MKVRIATFNCENLFRRFKFNKNVNPLTAIKDGWLINQSSFEIVKPDEKRLTGQVVRAVDADVIALQEVDNFDVLKRFRTEFLKGAGYEHAMLVDGNDTRGIDVAVLSRHPLTRVRSYQHLKSGKSWLFSRDLLEVDVAVNGNTLTLFVNHLKSMLDKNDPAGGRRNTRARRLVQAKKAREIVEGRFGANAGTHPFVVLGDFNDYLGPGQGTTDGIHDLVEWDQVVNVVTRLPAAERWTHFYDGAPAGTPAGEKYKQLDYLLVSTSLAGAMNKLPSIERRGLCRHATQYTGARFASVGASRPAASDHCAVSFDVDL